MLAKAAGRTSDRLSDLVQPQPFDYEAFKKDPESYLSVIVPGRIWQTAQGAHGVKSLDPIGTSTPTMKPLTTIALQVQAEPLAPVTFSTMDRGAFENDLTVISVQADKHGVATVHFTATEGTIADVNILAASPLNVGHAKFVVYVKESPFTTMEK